jgi:RimJ/RimL family protein N-acetyltransferase
MQFTTTRLVLRDYRDTDFAAMRAYDSDPLVQQYRGAVTITEQQTWAYLQQTKIWAHEQPRSRYPLAVARQTDDIVIGWAPLTITNPALREAEIGWTITRHCWGRGYATEAAAQLMAFGFRDLRLHRIYAVCRVENTASWRIMEKLGMRREAQHHEVQWTDGAWRDHYLYAILDREWQGGVSKDASQPPL